MTIGVFSEAQFDCAHKILHFLVSMLMHIPTRTHKPIFEVIL